MSTNEEVITGNALLIHAQKLAHRLQIESYNHGFEDATPTPFDARQDKFDEASHKTLADLLNAIRALASNPKVI